METSPATRMIGSLGVPLQLFRIEIDVAQISGDIPVNLITEVPRLRMPAFPAGSDRPGFYLIPKFHHRDEAVPLETVPLLCTRIGLCSECSQRTKGGRSKSHRRAGLAVVEMLHDISGQTLITIDLSP